MKLSRDFEKLIMWALTLSFPFHTIHKHVVHENVVGGSSMTGFPLVIAVSERDMPGIEPGPLGWHTSALINELHEVRQ